MDNTNTTQELTSEERMLGLFSHLSLFLGGIILPIIFWALQKDKSKFVKFHSLQCIFFHLAYIAFIIAFVMIMVLFAAGGGLLAQGGGKEMSGVFAIFMVIFYLLIFVVIFGFIGYAIYMGVKTYQGELKKYPIIGNIIYKKVYGAAS